MRGLASYTVACGMSLHFNRKGYDGWKYLFKTKMAQKSFLENRQTQFVYGAVESKYPTLIDQVRYFYPYFKRYGAWASKTNIRKFDIEYKKFTEYVENIEKIHLPELLNTLKLNVSSISELFQVDNLLPKIYRMVDEGVISYDQAVLLFLVIPDLNSTSSNEPFVFDAWKADITFDKKFLSVYISPPSLIAMQNIAKDSFNDT